MRNLLFLIVPICFLFHLFTLGRLPLPTNEEVEFASTAHYISQKGIEHLFSPDFDPSFRTSFAKAPLPILANAGLLEKYPLNAFNIRLLNTIFSFFVVLMMLFFFSKLERGSFKNASFIMTLAFLFDPLLTSKAHTTTNEWIALFFFLVSIKKEFDKEGHTFRSTLSAAFFMSVALCCSYSLLLFLPFLLLHKIISAFQDTSENQSRSFYHVALWPLLVALFYLPWFFSFFDVYTFYAGLSKQPSLVFLPRSEYLVCLTAGGLFLYALFQSYSFEYPALLRLCIGIIFSYHMASYFLLLSPVLVIPFYYLLIFNLLPLNLTSNEARKTRYFPIVFLVAVHFLACILLFVYVCIGFQNREGTELKEFAERHISPHRHVSGDASFYYGVAANGHAFRPIPNETKLRACINAHDFDYLLLSPYMLDKLADSSLLSLHAENMVKLGSLTYAPDPMAHFMSLLDLAEEKEETMYSCILYRYK